MLGTLQTTPGNSQGPTAEEVVPGEKKSGNEEKEDPTTEVAVDAIAQHTEDDDIEELLGDGDDDEEYGDDGTEKEKLEEDKQDDSQDEAIDEQE